jgi:replicative DNA helicase
MTEPDLHSPTNGTPSAATQIAALDFAIDYARRGWPVLPVQCPISNQDGTHCSCAKADCKAVAKHPATSAGLKDATLDEVMIEMWFSGPVAPNIGLRAGRAGDGGGGFIVLDIDPRNGGTESLAQLESEHGPLPATPTEKTGGGGLHFFFAHPSPDKPVKNCTRLWPGIDLKADGGYVVVAPSRHKSGGDYVWSPGRTPADVALAPAPSWLLDAVEQRGSRAKAPSGARPPTNGASAGQPGPVHEGGRNTHLTSLGGTLRHRGCEEEVIVAALTAENQKTCTPPLDDGEVRAIAASVARYPAGEWTLGKEYEARQKAKGPTDEQVAALWALQPASDIIAQLEDRWSRGDTVTKTGLAALDALLGGGLRPGDVLALGGAAGASKSALAGQIGYDVSGNGGLVIVASVEMPPAEIHARWLTLEMFRHAMASSPPFVHFGDVYRGRVRRGECSQDAARSLDLQQRLDGAIQKLKGHSTLYVQHVPPGTTPAMLGILVKRAREKHPDLQTLLVVDPIQRLYASESLKRRGRALDSINSTEVERVGAVAQELKHMADAEGVSVIFTSDTTKGAVLNNASSASSLRGSYALNHLATTVLGLHTANTAAQLEDKTKGLDEPLSAKEIIGQLPAWWGSRVDVAQLGPRVVLLECSKNRQGRAKSFALGFIGGAMAFVERDQNAAAAPLPGSHNKAAGHP